MVSLHKLVEYADELLETAEIPDYPAALNGLQLENSGDIKGIASAVDFSTKSIQGTIDAGANLLVLHHGMFWNGFGQVTGPAYRRMSLLIEHDIAVYSSHLPLDRHPRMGNNALLAKELDLRPTGLFAKYDTIFIGINGESDIATIALVEKTKEFVKDYGGDVRTTSIPETRRTKRWAICSGAGASTDTVKEALKMGIDTLIVGEGPHHTSIQAEENNLSIIYAGHYATETLGVRALADHLGERYKIPASFINLPTGL